MCVVAYVTVVVTGFHVALLFMIAARKRRLVCEDSAILTTYVYACFLSYKILLMIIIVLCNMNLTLGIAHLWGSTDLSYF